MKEHEAVRAMLPLAAAGALDPEEERRVRAHTAGCQACESELGAWQALGEELAALPAVLAPPPLVERTQARVRAALCEEDERRWDETALALLSLLACTVGLATWAVWRLAMPGVTGGLTYLTVSTLVTWLTAGVAALIAGQRRRALGRSI
ncbi:MAG: zf-HC2 domain-containing protein [Acidobacteria bacterium]|nr:zf-HC2 domain-containing protein [Acidobacteriota bacterium]